MRCLTRAASERSYAAGGSILHDRAKHCVSSNYSSNSGVVAANRPTHRHPTDGDLCPNLPKIIFFARFPVFFSIE